MTKSELSEIIGQIADEHHVDRHLAVAIAMVESGLDCYKVRYEPSWKYFLDAGHFAAPLGITWQTEQQLQAMSWGPMQCMGSLARQWNYTDHLTKMTDPQISVHYSCLQLGHLLKIYRVTTDAVSAYNQGVPKRTDAGNFYNQSYVNSVMENYNELHK